MERKRKELELSNSFPALVIFDKFKGQCTDAVMQVLSNNNVYVVIVPAACTDRLQSLDLSVNKSAKEFLRGRFHEWYSQKIFEQLQQKGCTVAEPVDLKLSVMKPLGAYRMMQLYDYFKLNHDIILNGFHAAGLL